MFGYFKYLLTRITKTQIDTLLYLQFTQLAEYLQSFEYVTFFFITAIFLNHVCQRFSPTIEK